MGSCLLLSQSSFSGPACVRRRSRPCEPVCSPGAPICFLMPICKHRAQLSASRLLRTPKVLWHSRPKLHLGRGCTLVVWKTTRLSLSAFRPRGLFGEIPGRACPSRVLWLLWRASFARTGFLFRWFMNSPRNCLNKDAGWSSLEGEQAELEYTFTIQSAPEEAQISRFTSKNTSKGFLAPPYISAWKTAPSFLEQRGSSSAKPGSAQHPFITVAVSDRCHLSRLFKERSRELETYWLRNVCCAVFSE